jgi:hypothetical protein
MVRKSDFLQQGENEEDNGTEEEEVSDEANENRRIERKPRDIVVTNVLKSTQLTKELTTQLIQAVADPATVGRLAIQLYVQFLSPQDLDKYRQNPDLLAEHAQQFLIELAKVYRMDDKIAGAVQLITQQANLLSKLKSELIEERSEIMYYQHVYDELLDFIKWLIEQIRAIPNTKMSPILDRSKAIQADMIKYKEVMDEWRNKMEANLIV